jgi:prepilin-type N-terminal cleavage/methylation domain-containing protein
MRYQSTSRCSARLQRSGFSLIELLVVITILVILIALLMTAIQAVREMANRVRCANNLKNWGVAVAQHHVTWKRLPAGGWGWNWAGDPDQPNDKDQPGGWLYNLLPYVEQGNLHDLSKGLQGQAKMDATRNMVQSSFLLANCPTRRPPTVLKGGYTPVNASALTLGSARTDYAANAGSTSCDQYYGGPGSISQGMDPTYTGWHDTSTMTGVCFERSELRYSDVTRGASNVFMIGEKYLDPDFYYNGASGSDNENMYNGFDNDMFRDTASTPMQDLSGYSDDNRFGSAHKSVFNMLYVDGGVRQISYNVNSQVFLQAGSRY